MRKTKISNIHPCAVPVLRFSGCFNFFFFARVKSNPFHFCLSFSFLNEEIKKKEDETPNELVFLLRALLVCSLVLDCLQCYWVGDKNSWRYMPWGQGFLELHALGSGITWISPVNLGTADSFLGQH